MPKKERAALKEEFGLGIPIQAALDMTSKGIMAGIILTLKETEIQHLKF